ncbi:MAG TPA: competence/damage-inducible protein A [Polyangiaceae bacterium LLY-WYZ-14_1]|nr:competence/damage-inducible protein A [Polyangiaceae bacterium LLY-WYZ-14_1]
MQAAVLSIGTELTRGELIDTNAAWLSEQLTSLGFEVTRLGTVGDDEAAIGELVAELAAHSRVVVATGGLGPTSDDRTTSAVARVLGVPLVRDGASLARLERRYAALGRAMPPSNAKQADFPEGADILPNPLGTAPGFAVRLGAARLFFMPGVPKEMMAIFEASVKPEVGPLGHRTTHMTAVRVFGLGESQVAEALDGVEALEPGIVLGYRASFPEVEVKVIARAETEAAAQQKAQRVMAVVRERLGEDAYGDRDDSYPAAVGRTLRHSGKTLAIAESCTGGLLGGLVTSVPGSSDYLLLDAVTYANAAKTRVLGVSEEVLRAHGAVSSETAAAMAEGALRLGESDLAISVTGIAGPGGGTDTKPVGTVWFGLAQRGIGTRTERRLFNGDRERIRTLAAYAALQLVDRAARGKLNGH